MREQTLTEQEAIALAEIINSAVFESIDARDDMRADSDPLGDARRIGERLSAGFALLNMTD